MVYRILSLDGGGVRGILAAQMLTYFEELIYPQPLHEYFDLIAGTSTGSILAAGISIGMTAKQLVELYATKTDIIFPYWGTWGYLSPKRIPLILKYGISAPKFSHDGLIKVLQEEFGKITLAEVTPEGSSRPNLLIPSYDTIHRKPIVFKSWRHEMPYANLFLWETCVCSASAPTFFPAYGVIDATGNIIYSAVDGGLGANNPAACAVAEALRLNLPISDLAVLSIGTGEMINPFPYRKVRGWGVIQWAGKIVDILMDASLEIHEYITREIVCNYEDNQRYLRLQPLLTSEYLQKVLDEELLLDLLSNLPPKPRKKVRKGEIEVVQGLDVASNYNLQILRTLGKAYVKNGLVIDRPVSERLQEFVRVSS
ncbi:MAG: patatin-like phospholipase family protein [Oscillatoria sp. PMC 1051.18]|nr:patatin-like phospholipase family protein [Oscillatoria sp. PMC 1050.18]MEC5029003.1 patatin-like phospholipase family protein [Oscillatoria sp. PMC 1051.18]